MNIGDKAFNPSRWKKVSGRVELLERSKILKFLAVKTGLKVLTGRRENYIYVYIKKVYIPT